MHILNHIYIIIFYDMINNLGLLLIIIPFVFIGFNKMHVFENLSINKFNATFNFISIVYMSQFDRSFPGLVTTTTLFAAIYKDFVYVILQLFV